MGRCHSVLAALLFAIAAPTSGAAQAPVEAPADAVTIVREEWRDSARDRTVPVKLYIPAGAGPFPVVIHSHGLGGSREGSTVILNAVSRAGFLVVALQHAGSDTGILDEGLTALAARPEPVGARAAIER